MNTAGVADVTDFSIELTSNQSDSFVFRTVSFFKVKHAIGQ
jgi:hypothetical protein